MTKDDPRQRPAIPNDQVPPGRDLLEMIEGRWTLHILLCLSQGDHRFSDLRSAIPQISAKMLTERLRSLQSAGLIERHYLPPPSVGQIYGLSSLAAGLRPALDALASWQAEEHDMPGHSS